MSRMRVSFLALKEKSSWPNCMRERIWKTWFTWIRYCSSVYIKGINCGEKTIVKGPDLEVIELDNDSNNLFGKRTRSVSNWFCHELIKCDGGGQYIAWSPRGAADVRVTGKRWRLRGTDTVTGSPASGAVYRRWQERSSLSSISETAPVNTL